MVHDWQDVEYAAHDRIILLYTRIADARELKYPRKRGEKRSTFDITGARIYSSFILSGGSTVP